LTPKKAFRIAAKEHKEHMGKRIHELATSQYFHHKDQPNQSIEIPNLAFFAIFAFLCGQIHWHI
jgi:hypothetical protein